MLQKKNKHVTIGFMVIYMRCISLLLLLVAWALPYLVPFSSFHTWQLILGDMTQFCHKGII